MNAHTGAGIRGSLNRMADESHKGSAGFRLVSKTLALVAGLAAVCPIANADLVVGTNEVFMSGEFVGDEATHILTFTNPLDGDSGVWEQDNATQEAGNRIRSANTGNPSYVTWLLTVPGNREIINFKWGLDDLFLANPSYLDVRYSTDNATWTSVTNYTSPGNLGFQGAQVFSGDLSTPSNVLYVGFALNAGGDAIFVADGTSSSYFEVTTQVVPEPASAVLLLAGIAVVMGRFLCRKRGKILA